MLHNFQIIYQASLWVFFSKKALKNWWWLAQPLTRTPSSTSSSLPWSFHCKLLPYSITSTISFVFFASALKRSLFSSISSVQSFIHALHHHVELQEAKHQGALFYQEGLTRELIPRTWNSTHLKFYYNWWSFVTSTNPCIETVNK